MRMPILHLPMEVIREILSWLPVKSVCRFRCVSKSWKSLILDPQFVKLHSEKALEHEDVFYQRRRVMIKDDSCHCLFSLDLDEFLDQNDIDNLGDNHDLLVKFRALRSKDLSGEDYYHGDDDVDDNEDLYPRCCIFSRVVLCCEGMLLLLGLFRLFGNVCLLNPATRESKVLPDPPEMFTPETGDYYYCVYGFAFDRCTQDYKVVKGDCCEGELKFCVYSLRNNSWLVIERQHHYEGFQSGQEGKVLNGGIHWVVQRNFEPEPSMVILCFLLSEEEVREIPLPTDFDIVYNEEVNLSVVGECLCMIPKYYEKHEAFWVMKKYRVRESWTQIRVCIPSLSWSHSGFWKNGYDLVLFKAEGKLVLLNSDEETFRNLSFDQIRIGYVGIYLESLFSPNFPAITD
ncbi:hypothetical protein ACLB2K_021577 [Fragaria x ananassa]